MQETLRTLFNLYPGEGKRAALFAILAFLWSLGGYGFLTLSEGMFLEHVGAAALPSVYLTIAISMCILSTLLLLALDRFSLHTLLSVVITGAIACNLFIYFLLSTTSVTQSLSFWYSFKILGWIIPIATYVCFWAFVDQYYDLQDAKRFFCLFNSVTFFGDACAGGLISLLLETMGLSKLIALFSVFMTASLPFIYLILKRVKAVPEGFFEEMQPTQKLKASSLITIVLKSRFTLILMGLYFVMQLLAVTTEFNYMKSFETVFKGEGVKRNLTEFLGTCGMWVSLCNMLFCLLFYSRLVKKIGISNIILIAPSFFAAVFFIWLWEDALPIAILGFIAREGMVYAFDDNNLNLLISGVPTKAKNQVRIAIESFFEPIGMLVSALLLLAFQHQSRFLGLILACGAISVVYFLRSHYHRAIFHNLVSNSIRFEKKVSDWISNFSKKERREVEFDLISKLRLVEEPTQLLAYEYLLKIQNPRLLPRLLNQFSKLSISGKMRAIDLLGESPWAKETIVIEYLEKWRRLLPHPSIKSSIHFYFARHAILRPEKILADLDHEHLGLRGAAILSLKTTPKESVDYSAIALEKLQTLLESSDEMEVAMGIRILGMENRPENLELLTPFLDHPSLTIQRSTARAIASIANSDWKAYAPFLAQRLRGVRDPETKAAYLDALDKFNDPHSIKQLILASVHFRPHEKKRIETLSTKIGHLCIQDLLGVLQDPKVHVRCRLLAGKILGRVGLDNLRLRLYPLAHEEILRAYFYFYHAISIQKEVPKHDLSVLENVLFTSYESTIDFIIQILGVAGAIEESEILSYSLRSKNRKIRAQAIETLVKTCDPRIFSLLEPLIEDFSPEEKRALFLKLGGVPLSLSELLDHLAHSGSLSDQIISLSFKARLNAPGWRESLRNKVETEEDIFRNLAHELLEKTSYETSHSY